MTYITRGAMLSSDDLGFVKEILKNNSHISDIDNNEDKKRFMGLTTEYSGERKYATKWRVIIERNPNGKLEIIVAPAGLGKTHTIIDSVKRLCSKGNTHISITAPTSVTNTVLRRTIFSVVNDNVTVGYIVQESPLTDDMKYNYKKMSNVLIIDRNTDIEIIEEFYNKFKNIVTITSNYNFRKKILVLKKFKKKRLLLIDEVHGENHTNGSEADYIYWEQNPGNGFNKFAQETYIEAIKLGFACTGFTATNSEQQKNDKNNKYFNSNYMSAEDKLEGCMFLASVKEYINLYDKSNPEKTIDNIINYLNKYSVTSEDGHFAMLFSGNSLAKSRFNITITDIMRHQEKQIGTWIYWYSDIKVIVENGVVVEDISGLKDISTIESAIETYNPDIVVSYEMLSTGFDYLNIDGSIFCDSNIDIPKLKGVFQRVTRCSRPGKNSVFIGFMESSDSKFNYLVDNLKQNQLLLLESEKPILRLVTSKELEGIHNNLLDQLSSEDIVGSSFSDRMLAAFKYVSNMNYGKPVEQFKSKVSSEISYSLETMRHSSAEFDYMINAGGTGTRDDNIFLINGKLISCDYKLTNWISIYASWIIGSKLNDDKKKYYTKPNTILKLVSYDYIKGVPTIVRTACLEFNKSIDESMSVITFDDLFRDEFKDFVTIYDHIESKYIHTPSTAECVNPFKDGYYVSKHRYYSTNESLDEWYNAVNITSYTPSTEEGLA